MALAISNPVTVCLLATLCVCPGGRQLDYSPSALDMLPGVVAAVGGRVPVWMDGGIRRGTDVLKVSHAAHQGVTAAIRVCWGRCGM